MISNEIISLLYQYFLIDKTQHQHVKLEKTIVIKINGLEYQAIPEYRENCYRLKSNQHYLLCNDNILYTININDINIFNKKFYFFLIYNNIATSIIPYCYQTYMVCIESNILVIKKIISLLNNKNITIFQIDRQNIINKTNKVKPDIVSGNKITKIPRPNFFCKNNYKWLNIVSGIDNIPSELSQLVTYSIDNKNVPVSIIYLTYIIKYYENLPNFTLFIGTYPIKLKINMKKSNSICLFNYLLTAKSKPKKYFIDMKVDLLDTQKNYIFSNYTENIISYKKKITQSIFWSHVLKFTIKNKFISYASNNTRLVSKSIIHSYPKQFYENIYRRFMLSKDYSLEYLDRSWDTIFKSY